MHHAYYFRMSNAQTTNLLGAFALALADDLEEATVAGARHGANAPAAIITVGTYPGETIESLCRTVGLSHSATVRLVDRLAADGLLERRRGTDGRSSALHLTRVGKRRMAEILARRRDVLTSTLSLLGAGERKTLGHLLRKMLRAGTRGRGHADHICRLCDGSACPLETCPVEAAAS